MYELTDSDIEKLQAIAGDNQKFVNRSAYEPQLDQEEIWQYIPHAWRHINNVRGHVILHLPHPDNAADQACYLEGWSTDTDAKKITEDIKPIRYRWCRECLRAREPTFIDRA